MNVQNTQDGFQLMQQLAALCATPGVSEENIKSANEGIANILSKIILPTVQELTAKASGLIVK